jgi:inorganic pyrophosphatase
LKECYERYDEYKERIQNGEKSQILEEWHKKGLGLGK